MSQEKILILDFGSQYTQLIARRVRELNIYSEIHPYNNPPEITEDFKGVILSGSPFSVRDENAPIPNLDGIKGVLPLLGVCYGAQHLAKANGGEVLPSKIREYGRANLSFVNHSNPLFAGISEGSQVWMSHGDTITSLPDSCEIIASTKDVQVAGYQFVNENTFSIQFHPEVYHSTDGKTLLSNFLVNICKCSQDWTPDSFVQRTVDELKAKLSNDKVVLGLSGGVDSTVAAVLLNRAIGKNLYCIFVDNGLLRKGEFESVLEQYKGMGLNVKGVDAKSRFYEVLDGISDPEAKRKAIGHTFIDIFDAESKKLKNAKWLGQGTIYPDVIESAASATGKAHVIKSHHNVGGLPEKMGLKLVEPLRELFKDEVRALGRELGLPSSFIGRHPFPGPGLAIRCPGEITRAKLDILREADAVYIDQIRKHGLYDDIWQAFVAILPVRTVGVMGDGRTYDFACALRAVTSVDGMTADYYPFTHEFLGETATRIINEVSGINRVTYDITSKPPGTIEWE